jgi:hypothetical protein
MNKTKRQGANPLRFTLVAGGPANDQQLASQRPCRKLLVNNQEECRQTCTSATHQHQDALTVIPNAM